MTSELEFVSIACNRVSNAADWCLDGTVAYAAGNFVAIYHPESFGQNTGSGSAQHDDAIVSGSADGTCRIWKKTQVGKYKTVAELRGHTSGVNCLAVSRGRDLPDGPSLVVAGSLDGWIRVWDVEDLDVENGKPVVLEPVQSLNVSPKYPLCLALACLPNVSTQILVTGNTDNKLTVYAHQNHKFVPLLTLHGHKDWIRAIDLATYTKSPSSTDSSQTPHFNDGDLILASASQDKYIRLWRIAPSQDMQEESVMDVELPQDRLDELVELGDSALAGMKLATKAYIIDVDVDTRDNTRSVTVSRTKAKYSIMFDAMLVGHEDWVHSVFWHLPIIKDGTYHQPMRLISSSTDRSIYLWSPDADTTMWINEVRVGDVSGLNLGFYGAILSPDGRTLLAHAYNGAISLWEQGKEDQTVWMPRVGVSGHSDPVTGLEWDPRSRYLITVSGDQTTRLWSKWIRDGIYTWHEMSRPQIHGYDLQCVAFINKYCFVSGADEKVVRVFEAPRTFVESLENWTGIKDEGAAAANLPLGASLPALGLSNKAVYYGDGLSSGPESSRPTFDAPLPTFTATTGAFMQPPFEHHLSTTTLWPEINKLYGHGFELFALGASHDGCVLASSCKAAKPEHAGIRIWSTSTWREICSPLMSHSLTVTGIKFSYDDRYILTVGRDRMWSLFVKSTEGDVPYKLLCSDAKAHSRIIWDASWTHDTQYFATGSRDKSIKIWKASGETMWEACLTIKTEESVTSVSFMPVLYSEGYCLAAGLEDGRIILYLLIGEELRVYGIIHLDIE
ncbi:hypothetical protein SmJEL517_g03433 [Synchytrium microbalum]|uniref:Elongator complex protein 2 n=1 Tax=Synchytrium microbalum TaxID=1806994 RepID=A0A507C8A8_9FUNG|nr:uncharacterized protein SmJEL517_g03433 [Synchytrium microbalum]TPX33763.1 hypothetical protein SmJEL517_g03433 [Synchytrium microbalum]